MHNCKSPGRYYRGKYLGDLGYGNTFLRYNTEVMTDKRYNC